MLDKLLFSYSSVPVIFPRLFLRKWRWYNNCVSHLLLQLLISCFFAPFPFCFSALSHTLFPVVLLPLLQPVLLLNLLILPLMHLLLLLLLLLSVPFLPPAHSLSTTAVCSFFTSCSFSFYHCCLLLFPLLLLLLLLLLSDPSPPPSPSPSTFAVCSFSPSCSFSFYNC
jgi:hypothetical protein